MTFSEALDLLKQGKKIKRAGWGGYWFINTVGYFDDDLDDWGRDYIEQDMIIAKLKDGMGYAPAQAFQADLLAEDWEVVEQKPEEAKVTMEDLEKMVKEIGVISPDSKSLLEILEENK